MLELSHSHIDQLERKRKIQACYNQPTESILKSVTGEKLIELVEGEMKGKIHTKAQVEKVCEDLSKSAVQEDLEKGEKELGRLERITVVQENKTFEVYADCRDIEKGEYSDNALNQHLNRVGKKFAAVKEEEVA